MNRTLGMRLFRAVIPVILLSSVVLPNRSAAGAAPGKDAFVLMDAAEFKTALDTFAGRVTLVDARPRERYEDGHIGGALNLFAPDLEKDPSLLKAPKNTKILVYCDGVRCDPKTGRTPKGSPCRSMEAILPTKSGKAAMTIVNQGYGDVAVLYEGFPGWDLKGFEGFAGSGDDRRLEMAVLSAKELKAAIGARTSIVDLRLPSEFARGHVPGAINMPFAAFLVNAGSLDRSRRIIVYGSSIDQGHIAVRRLQKLGFGQTGRTVYEEWLAAGLPVEKKLR